MPDTAHAREPGPEKAATHHDTAPASAARLAAARRRSAEVYPADAQGPERALADDSAMRVLIGRDSLRGAGTGYRVATEDAAQATENLTRAEARLVGALATSDGTLRDLAESAGLDVDVVARVLGRGTVTVLTKPGCVQCEATARALTRRGIDFVRVDVTDDAQALDLARGLGYLSAPVVVTSEGEHWAGYRPERIAELGADPQPSAPPAPVGPGL